MFHAFANNPIKYKDPDGRQTSEAIDYTEFYNQLDLIARSIPGLAAAVGISFETGAAVAAKISPWVFIGMFVFCLTGDSSATARQSYEETALSPSEAKVLLNKMQLEIEGIKSKDRGNKFTEQYALVAKADGYYPNVRTGEIIYMKQGEVWKYGETSNPKGRYSQKLLNHFNLIKVREFSGSKEQCLIMEKIKLYNYYIENGCLPPGNKIFR